MQDDAAEAIVAAVLALKEASLRSGYG